MKRVEERYISREYEDSLKAYRDIKNSLDTAMEQGFEKGHEVGREVGRAEGRAEGREEGENLKAISIAKKMLEAGMKKDLIVNMTGLSKEDIDKLI